VIIDLMNFYDFTDGVVVIQIYEVSWSFKLTKFLNFVSFSQIRLYN